jgi:hypothetical protein
VPAKSGSRQKAAGAAFRLSKAKLESKLRGAPESMASWMSEKELEKMASTSRKAGK